MISLMCRNRISSFTCIITHLINKLRYSKPLVKSVCYQVHVLQHSVGSGMSSCDDQNCSNVGLPDHSVAVQVHNFGDPFLFRVTDSETLADIRPRIQNKLGVADEEFAKWKFAVICSLRPPDYLQDDDVVAAKFVKSNSNYNSAPDSMYLGLEHIDTQPHRHRHHTNRCALLLYLACDVVCSMPCSVMSCPDRSSWHKTVIAAVLWQS